jgi:hypothetical protein
LILAGEDLPFGATSPTDLGGRAICVVDAAGNVVLSGITPNKIPNDEHPRVAHCPLTRPDPPSMRMRKARSSSNLAAAAP